MTNIIKLVWGYIDTRIEIQKTLYEGLINTSSLARKIATEFDLEKNIDAIISAIRRYESKTDSRENYNELKRAVKGGRVSTKTKLSSILLARTDATEKRISTLYTELSLKRSTTLRIFEVTNYIKIIVDEEHIDTIKKLFSPEEITESIHGLGELTINYEEDITQISGLFALIANEMGLNEVSIIDSMICNKEHLLIIKEPDLEKALRIILNMH